MMRPASEVTHDAQLTIWSGEIVEAVSDHLPDATYGDIVDINLAIQNQLKRIISDAFAMAETDIM